VATGLARAKDNIRWVEEHCRVPEGKLVGSPVRLRKWQRDILVKIYATPTRRAIISFGRKNGKTALSAFLLLLHLCGPEARPNSQLFSAAQSREQAAVLFNLAAKCVRLSPTLSPAIQIRDTAKELLFPELGTRYRALSAEASTAFGLSPVFTVHDELGQVRGPRSALYEALETASGAHERPLSVVISTQAPTDADLLSILIDDAKTGKDPKVKLALFTAPPDAEPFEKKTIKLANPAFGDFQEAEETLAMAQDASRMPSREPEFRNLILNQRVESNAAFVAKTIWDANGGAVSEDWGEAPVYAALDLSSTNDLTAFVPIAWIDDAWETKPVFWLPGEGLREKARRDKVQWDVWESQGFLRTTPGRSVEYEFVARWLWDFYCEHNVQKIAFDRWGMKHLRPWLIRAGFDELTVDNVFEEFGQGFQSMSPALRDLESALLEKKVRHANHPVLTMCAATAVVTMDPAGNRKLNKAKSLPSKIDGLVAMAMAFGVAPLEGEAALDVFSMVA
jgi:phage terminase large subunit-like protein